MTGDLPVTTTGHPSYSLAEAHIRQKLDALLDEAQVEYGLTALEVADILSECSRYYLQTARRLEQRRNPKRKGAFGTPREGEPLPRC
jgi:hypothetical protein